MGFEPSACIMVGADKTRELRQPPWYWFKFCIYQNIIQFHLRCTYKQEDTSIPFCIVSRLDVTDCCEIDQAKTFFCSIFFLETIPTPSTDSELIIQCCSSTASLIDLINIIIVCFNLLILALFDPLILSGILFLSLGIEPGWGARQLKGDLPKW